MPDEITLLDGTCVVSLRRAARLAGVAERTVRNWDASGHLSRQATVRRTRYYRKADVLAAERATRVADPTQKRARAVARELAQLRPVGHAGA